MFSWAYARDILPALLKAAVVTVEATMVGFVLAVLLGLVLALARRSRRRMVSWPVGGLIEFVRSTPLLVQLYFLYYVLPEYGIALSAFLTGVLALGIHYSCYTAEVYRAGLESVPRGQWEAAVTLNLTKAQMFWHVILPQALPPIVPPLGNYLIAMFKETPLLSAITVLEMLMVAKLVGSESFRYLEPISLIGALFLLMSVSSAALIRHVERRLGRAPGLGSVIAR